MFQGCMSWFCVDLADFQNYPSSGFDICLPKQRWLVAFAIPLTISKIQCYGCMSWFFIDLLTWPIFQNFQAQDLTYVPQNSVDLLPLLCHWQYLKSSVTDVCPDSPLTCWLGRFSKISKLRLPNLTDLIKLFKLGKLIKLNKIIKFNQVNYLNHVLTMLTKC